MDVTVVFVACGLGGEGGRAGRKAVGWLPLLPPDLSTLLPWGSNSFQPINPTPVGWRDQARMHAASCLCIMSKSLTARACVGGGSKGPTA